MEAKKKIRIEDVETVIISEKENHANKVVYTRLNRDQFLEEYDLEEDAKEHLHYCSKCGTWVNGECSCSEENRVVTESELISIVYALRNDECKVEFKLKLTA